MKIIPNFFVKYYKFKEIKFLIFGGLNTLFAYFSSLFVYYNFEKYLGLFLTLLVINIINISFSFFVLKIYVFKSKGRWLAQYLRSYITYANIFILNVLLLFLFLKVFYIPFYISSFLVIVLCTSVSYILNLKFTFR